MLNDRIRRCAHVKTNGTQCGAPAARANEFCHFHWRAAKDFPHRRQRKPIPEPIIDLTLIDDPDDIHYAIMQIVQGMLNGTISDKLSGRLIYALQVMSTNFKMTSMNRMLESEYHKSNLNAYEIWDKYAKINEEQELTELHEKRKQQIAELERTCCKCKEEVDSPDQLTPPLPPAPKPIMPQALNIKASAEEMPCQSTVPHVREANVGNFDGGPFKPEVGLSGSVDDAEGAPHLPAFGRCGSGVQSPNHQSQPITRLSFNGSMAR